jgi:hypothetical protein
MKDYFLPKKEPMAASSAILLLTVLILAVAAGLWFLVFSGVWQKNNIAQNPAGNQDIIAKQLEELGRMKAAATPLSQEEVQSQMNELSKMKAEKSASIDEINNQLEDLNNIKK